MDKLNIKRSSGNIYKDLGFPNAEEMQAKAMLVSSIISIIDSKKWTQTKAAEVLEIPQSKVSLLCRGHFAGFSMEKLMHFLNKLSQDIEIIIKSQPVSSRHIGHISVTHAAA